ncbi:hypothetical protein AQI95_22160 [Streptomyces yokosukanensis]|uniref:Integral membrane protein n=2 Tax=Streptomyces yokosukanensis TaxID=67386 RepID=A0A101P3A5_9ACTN|nr:hypothetical protein AQI95_22160 [Streptomyces yokosukanensis]
MNTAMRAGGSAGRARRASAVPVRDVLLSAIAAVSWALTAMAGTAALGLHLLKADAAGPLGPMTAAVVALGAGGSVTPSGNVSAFGLKGAESHIAVEIAPLGVGLVGALLVSWFFLRSLRTAGVAVAPAELLVRAGTVVALFVAMLAALAQAGHDVVTVDGGSLAPHRIDALVHAKAAVGFRVDTAATLLGGAGWCSGALLIALLASRRTPLPPGWSVVHRVVRPAVSALVTVLLTAVAAGLAAAAYAAIGDDHPGRIAGAALLGAPNGVWLGLPLGLFVPWDGHATGVLAGFLPHPLDRLLGTRSDGPVTLGRLAELDGRVWLLAVAAALAMLPAGVLTALRTPVLRPPDSALGLAARCALGLGISTALALPLLARLTDVSLTASLSVLGADALGTALRLHGHLGAALLLGAAWGAGAGAGGALTAWATGAVGVRAVRTTGAVGAQAPRVGEAAEARAVGATEAAGGRAGRGATAKRGAAEREWPPERGGAAEAGMPAERHGSVGRHGPVERGGAVGASTGSGSGAGGGRRPGEDGGPGPYAPSAPYRPPNPDTNPYLHLQVPEDLRDAAPEAGQDGAGGRPPSAPPGKPGHRG